MTLNIKRAATLRRLVSTLGSSAAATYVAFAGHNAAAAGSDLQLPRSDHHQLGRLAGNLALTQRRWKSIGEESKLVSKITYTKAPVRNCRQDQNHCRARADRHRPLVLTGTTPGRGHRNRIVTTILPDYAAKLAGCSMLSSVRRKMQTWPRTRHRGDVHARRAAARIQPGQGEERAVQPQELLAWCKANPNRLIYARPLIRPGEDLSDGPALPARRQRSKDPLAGWDKTWAYLKNSTVALNISVRHRRGDEGAR